MRDRNEFISTSSSPIMILVLLILTILIGKRAREDRSFRARDQVIGEVRGHRRGSDSES